MRVFLVGMMGAGKTTLGTQLAKELDHPFVDMDEYLVQREQRTIAQLFEQEGAEKFRVLERKALESVVQEYEDVVIATGGGMPCFHNNMEFINNHGTSLFLDVPGAELVQRLSATDLTVRPLLAEKTAEELTEFIAKTLADRRPFYQKAHFRFEGVADKDAILATLLNKRSQRNN